MPVAPIRIAALDGCQELARSVECKLVKFRKELVSENSSASFPRVTAKIPSWSDANAPVTEPVRAKATSRILSAVRTYILWST